MNDRTRAAVVGLAKAGPETDPPDNLAFAARPGDAPEARFLLSTAAATVYEAAGRLPDPAPAPPPPCDDRPCPPPPAGLAGLAAEVCGEGVTLLRELCERLTARGFVLPPAVLAAAFGAAGGGGGAARSAATKRAVAVAAGPRGRWLAAFNPDWAWVLEHAPAPAPRADGSPSGSFEDRFAADEFSTRLAAFKAWRSADPAAARAALDETWKGETAFRRAALLEAFETGLSPADEPFLETARGDRSKAVPQVAADLLVRLPGSAFAAAVRTAADSLLSIGGRLKPKLTVILPPGKGGRTDGDGGFDWGSLGGGAGDGRGVRAERLVRVLAAVPPSHWADRFGKPPADLIALAGKAEHGGDVSAGWLAACARFAPADPAVAADWAPAFGARAAGRLNRTRRANGPARHVEIGDVVRPLTGLLSALPPADAAAVAAPLLATAAAKRDPADLGSLLWGAVPDPWPADFARAVAAFVEDAGTARGYEYHVWHPALPDLLERLPPAVLAELPPGWPVPGDPPNWLEKAVAGGALRRRIHQLLP